MTAMETAPPPTPAPARDRTMTVAYWIVGVFALLAVAGFGAIVAVSANAEKDTRKCEQLRQDALAMTQYMTKPYDLEQARKNNERVEYLGCVWATDGVSGPAYPDPDAQWSHNE